MKSTLKTIAVILVIAAGLFCLYRFDFYVWRSEHPTAPTWTYWVRSHK